MPPTMDENVKKVQEALALCGYYPGEADGMMGPNTKAAVKKFQEAKGLGVDGIPGPNTRKALAGELGGAIARATSLMAELSG